MSKKEFLKLEQNKTIRRGILTSAIFCYISAGITTLLGLFSIEFIEGVNTSYVILLDAIIILTIGLLIHLKQSFPASVILLIYGIANTIYLTVKTGMFGGWLILIAGASAVYYVYKLNKNFKHFNNIQDFTSVNNLEETDIY